MKIEFDPRKSERNRSTRGLLFERVDDFEWESAVCAEDVRHAYPERRFVALGYVGARLHVLCFTPVASGIRVISFRKANVREVRYYHEEKAADDEIG